MEKLGSAENEVVGFIQQTYNSNVRIGRLDRNYKSTNIWYDQPSNISYNSLFLVQQEQIMEVFIIKILILGSIIGYK